MVEEGGACWFGLGVREWLGLFRFVWGALRLGCFARSSTSGTDADPLFRIHRWSARMGGMVVVVGGRAHPLPLHDRPRKLSVRRAETNTHTLRIKTHETPQQQQQQ